MDAYMNFHSLTTPIDNPVLILTIVMSIILLSPIVLRKLKIPGIVGLIISGMIIGPNGFNIILRDKSIVLFGTIGLLYIMFLAGLELDMFQFNKNKSKGFTYGALLFLIPLAIGVFVTTQILGLTPLQASLISIMLSTNTLVSYPIVQRLGLTRNQAVITAVAGTIITDTCVLLSLGVIEKLSSGELTAYYFIEMAILYALYLVLIFKGFPYISKKFFAKSDSDQSSQYVFVMATLFLGAFISQLIGLEPIIGAFLTGLALNRLIPNSSVLMGRIEFIGNSLFIPIFLISVGMLVDIKILFREPDSIGLALIFYGISILGIIIATEVAKKLFKFSGAQRRLILGLNSSHAAATIAITMVGYNMGALNEVFINATVILILVSCVVSSFIVERNGKVVAIETKDKAPSDEVRAQRILTPFSNPKNVEKLLSLAFALKDKSSEALYPLSVVMDNETTHETILNNYSLLSKAKRQAESIGVRLQLVTRVDTNIAEGIARAIREILADTVILGWTERSHSSDSLFGAQFEHLLNLSGAMTLIAKLKYPINTCEKLFVVAPENAELEIGFELWIRTVAKLCSSIGADIVFLGFEKTLIRVNSYIKKNDLSIKPSYKPVTAIEDFKRFANLPGETDILVIVDSRTKGISYNTYYEQLAAKVANSNKIGNLIILYPEQSSVFAPDSVLSYSDVLDASLILENISLLKKLGNFVKKHKTKHGIK
jgi:Kef-type K+ transport system membrane component KefB